MKKKQIIGLGTLLLVCLLGLFTTSYASGYTLTRVDSDKIAAKYNYSSAKATGFWNAINDAQNNYDTIVINCYTANYGTWLLTAFNSSQVTNMTNVENINYMTVTCSGTSSQYGNDGNNYWKINRDNQNWTLGSGSQKRSAYMFISNNFYTYENAPWENIEVIGPFTAPFSFVEASTDTYADVWSYEDVPFYTATNNEDLYIGNLIVPDSVVAELTHYNNFYYRYGTWQFRELPSNSIYLEYLGEQNNSYYFETYLKKDYFYENTLYNIVWTDYSTDPYTLASANFYIKNINTVITNGVLDTSQTFSGDYYQQYEQEQQDIKDIDNISQGVADVILDDSEVNTILDNFNTSGEIAAYFGYQNFNEDQDSVFFEGKDIIFYCISETIEELMRSGDEHINISFHGEPYRTIHSRYFKTPSDNMLFIFLKWFLTFAGCYGLYANIFATGESLSKLNLWDAMNKNDVDLFIFRM